MNAYKYLTVAAFVAMSSGAVQAADVTPMDAVRVAEIMSSSDCTDNDADDYLVLTNITDTAVSLKGVGIVAWNAKKKTEVDSSLTYRFGDTASIDAHGSLKLTAKSDFGTGKLTNSDVGLRLYFYPDAGRILIQDCFVSADWFGGVCDGHGASFVALEFGSTVKDVSQWRASTQEPPPEGEELASVDGGYRFILKGDYTGARTISPTGAECRVILQGANVPGGLLLAGNAKFEFKPDEGSVNNIGRIHGPTATLKLEGEGAVRLEGSDTLVTVSNLNVKTGTFAVKSTGVNADKTPVVNVLGYVKQSGGAIDVDLSGVTGYQAYGIYVANKDLKDAYDENLGIIYVEISGGAFNASVSGAKSSALYVDKGSVLTTFAAPGAEVTAVLAGTEPRLVSTAGDLEIESGSFSVTMPASCSTVTDARVFKTDKDIGISGGAFNIEVRGPGAEIFSADVAGGKISVNGGTFELVASDDCFSAMDRITVDDGLIYAVSLNDDVLDSNGDMRIRGGTILAYATADGHEAFDVDPEATATGTNPHTLTVSNAVVFATGGKDAKWPSSVNLGANTKAVVLENQTASLYSGKYLKLVTAGGTAYAAKLPSAFANFKCAIFATVPGYDESVQPAILENDPEDGSQGFHDLYIWSVEETNQQHLRIHTIYGSTTGDGDTGEYIILTNVSDQVVSLAGLKLTVAKVDKDGFVDKPSCSILIVDGSVPAYGKVRLTQSAYAGSGWSKITNGGILFTLTDVIGGMIQTGEANFDLYPKADGNGSALAATSFGNSFPLTVDDWCVVAVTKEIEVPEFVTDGSALGFSGAAGTTGATFSMTIANPVEGVYYTVFTSTTLDGTFTAEANSTQFAGGTATCTLTVKADTPAKFAKIVVSETPYKAGDGI